MIIILLGATAVSSESIPSDAANLNHLSRSITTPAYALLVGVVLEILSKILSIPLTSLPTTLGKEHDTNDVNFVGLTEYNSSDGDKAEGSFTNNKRGKIEQVNVLYLLSRWGAGGQGGLLQEKEKGSGS